MKVTMVFAMMMLSTTVVLAHNNYTGRSGGAASRSTCASSCHGATGGTILASGFPAAYTPNQTYLISLSRGAGGDIVNFNASVRAGTGTTNAGTISAGTGTSVYNVSGETNGVHFTTSFGQVSGSFNWTAPPAGTGPVRFYLGGLQFDYDGPNTTIIADAVEASSPPPAPIQLVTLANPPHLQLNWPVVSGVTGYNIYRTTDFNGAPILIGASPTNAYTDSFVLDQADQRAFYVVTATRP